MHTHIYPFRVLTKFDIRMGFRPAGQFEPCRVCGNLPISTQEGGTQ